MKVEKHKSWFVVILDDDCEFARFYEFADLVESKFGLQFNNRLNDFDSLYWDFKFNGSALILYYNIYLGVSVLPATFKEAKEIDNENTIFIGSQLFELFNNKNWACFANSNTIGTLGSESGIIVEDIEHSDGARITLEKDCGDIPFAITLGIYGTMFHTEYLSELDVAKDYVGTCKYYINKYFDLQTIHSNKRDDLWKTKKNSLLQNLRDF